MGSATTSADLGEPRQDAQSAFHRLFGARQPRIVYRASDFIDYLLMIVATVAIVALSFGVRHPISMATGLLGLYMIAAFGYRNGIQMAMPVLLRRPQDVPFALLYKIQNIKPVYFIALALLIAENALIRLTPSWPHQVEWMRWVAFAAFYLHLGAITLYRTVSLVDHLRKQHIVHEVLSQSSWKRVLSGRSSVRLEIIHAYLTGILTHVVLLTPWYLVITHVQFSILLLPLVCIANLWIQKRFLRDINAWFYRDHWLGHNSELEFVYLHGSHHDAIPSGMIAVAGNGFLEGFMRNVVAYPTPFFNPLVACFAYTMEVQRDILFHQFIPGIFPRMSQGFRQICQHSTHHFGRLEPYGFCIKLDQPDAPAGIVSAFSSLPETFKNSAALEESLTGFEWDNPRHRWYLEMCEKYQ